MEPLSEGGHSGNRKLWCDVSRPQMFQMFAQESCPLKMVGVWTRSGPSQLRTSARVLSGSTNTSPSVAQTRLSNNQNTTFDPRSRAPLL